MLIFKFSTKFYYNKQCLERSSKYLAFKQKYANTPASKMTAILVVFAEKLSRETTLVHFSATFDFALTLS